MQAKHMLKQDQGNQANLLYWSELNGAVILGKFLLDNNLPCLSNTSSNIGPSWYIC
jgi:hypothetical protein